MYIIKVGGGAAIDEAAYARFAVDLADLHEAGTPFVVVHGGNAEFSRLSDRLGIPPRMITNDKGRVSRYTDRETIDAMLMTYCGKVNKTIVAAFQQAGINAVGLSAIDGRIATGRRKSVLRGTEDGTTKVLRDDHAGSMRAPARFMSSTKPGKLVLIVSPSSMRTGDFAARPICPMARADG